MLLAPVPHAVGRRLARSLPALDPHHMPVLRANATVTERYARALTDMGIRSVWVHDELSEGIEPVELVSSELRRRAAQTVSHALDGARDAPRRGAQLPAEVLRPLHAAVAAIGGGGGSHA